MLGDFRSRPLRFDSRDDELAFSGLEAADCRPVSIVRLILKGLFQRRGRI